MADPLNWRGRSLAHSLDHFGRDDWTLSIGDLNVRVYRLESEAMSAYDIKAVPGVPTDGHFFIAWLEVPKVLASRGVADNAFQALESARNEMLECADRVLAAIEAIDA